MRHHSVCLFALLFVLACATPLEREQKATALPFAEAWLAHLDAGEEELAWAATGAVAQQRLEKEFALKLWFGSRRPLGRRLTQRVEINWEQEDTFLRAVPDGTYWEIGFLSDFEHRRRVEENLLLSWEGQWRLIEYVIK
jgi:hypothetical protein